MATSTGFAGLGAGPFSVARITPVFADYNSTTPLCPPVIDAFLDWQDRTGNASSGHGFGQAVQARYDAATDALKNSLTAHSYEVFTCGSATEANAWWFHSILDGIPGVPRVITTAIEHPCVLAPLQRYADEGIIDLQVCGVTSDGVVDLDQFLCLLTPKTVLVSVMLASNDLGTIQPLEKITSAAHAVGALVHSDIVQAVGKMPLDLDALGVDALVASAHKCYAPVGCGVLMVRDADRLTPWLVGGAQQQQLRAGTVNAMGLDLFSVGVKYCYDQWDARVNVHDWGRVLCDGNDRLSPVVPIDSGAMLWNTLALAVSGEAAHDVMMRLDIQGIAVGTGSACSTGAVTASPSVLALGVAPSVAESVIRLSFGYPTTLAELGRIQAII
ncbi:MAG: cysteine desulfurase family protein [Candidatus Marinamargulisbacteria bacterium]